MQLTAQSPLASVVEVLESLLTALRSRAEDLTELDEAYRGEHSLTFLSGSFRRAIEARYKGFSDNWCAVVANSPAERLAVQGIRLDDGPGMSDAERALSRDWQLNDLDAQSSQGFLQALISGRSAALVWGDSDDNPVVTWEHPAQVLVAYAPDNPRKRVAAVKAWRDEDTEYATLYAPDAVWKFSRPLARSSSLVVVQGLRTIASGRGWAPRELPGETWPLPNPLGEVPVVEFLNRPLLGQGPVSEVKAALAMQRAINLLWAYLFNAADFASLPQRVVMGQEPPSIPIIDDNGVIVGKQPVPLDKLSQDRLLWLTGENTKIGSWPAADLAAFSSVIEVAVGHLAAQTRTPQHYLIGKMANLSADALKAAETGLVKKTEEAQLFLGGAVRDLHRLMALVRDDQATAEALRFGTVQWRDAESRSEAQLVDALIKLKDLGFPFEWLAERYGLSQPEIARLALMRGDALARILAGDAAALVGAPEEPTGPVAVGP